MPLIFGTDEANHVLEDDITHRIHALSGFLFGTSPIGWAERESGISLTDTDNPDAVAQSALRSLKVSRQVAALNARAKQAGTPTAWEESGGGL